VTRRNISSGSPWEGPYGYSRAVVAGNQCWVAGTADPTGRHPGDAAGQAREILGIIGRALGEAGFSFDDVVRVRTFVTRAADQDAVARVNGEVFGSIRPASTIVVVSALITPELLVEIEVDAARDG
jgi:enamine deaminase RidA (YjgF/YER057c/UK114 family)